MNHLYAQFINCLQAFAYWTGLFGSPVQAIIKESIVKGIGCGSYRLVVAESSANVLGFIFFFSSIFSLFFLISLDLCGPCH